MKADLPWPSASVLESMLSCNILVGNLAQSNISLIKSKWPEQLDKRCEQAGRHRQNAGALLPSPPSGKGCRTWCGLSTSSLAGCYIHRAARRAAADTALSLETQETLFFSFFHPNNNLKAKLHLNIYIFKLISSVFQKRSTTNPGTWYIMVKKQT